MCEGGEIKCRGGGGTAAGRGHYLSSSFSTQVEKCTYYYLEGTLLYKYFQTEKTHHNYSKSSKKGSPKYMYLTHHHTIMPPSNHALPNIIPG